MRQGCTFPHRVTAVLVLALVGSAPGSVLWAQTVRGRVVLEPSGVPLPASGVVQLTDQRGAVAATRPVDATGAFVLEVSAPGSYQLLFVSMTHEAEASPMFQLAAGQVVEHEFRARPRRPTLLDTVVIAGEAVPRFLEGFHRRRHEGFGEFLTREEIERWVPLGTTDVVRRFRAFTMWYDPADPLRPRIQSTRSALRGPPFANTYCPPLIFLDGVYLGTSEQVDVDFISVNALEGVEAYAGLSEVPIEWSRSGAECGALGFWSRPGGASDGPGRPVVLAAQVGARVENEAPVEARLGLRFGITLRGSVELVPAINVLLAVPHGSTVSHGGYEVGAALRTRPFGRASWWYVGAGGTIIAQRGETFGPFGTERRMTGHHLAVTGVAMPIGAGMTFAELQVLDPLRTSRARAVVFGGIGVRVQ